MPTKWSISLLIHETIMLGPHIWRQGPLHRPLTASHLIWFWYNFKDTPMFTGSYTISKCQLKLHVYSNQIKLKIKNHLTST